MRYCKHQDVKCLNEFELIRKYECAGCGAIMMCACDERIGRRFLPHQLEHGTELETQRRVPVSLGFQSSICRECRGLPAESHPVAAIHGRTSKIKRYYWRELAFRRMELFEEWTHAQGISPADFHGPEARAARRQVSQQALEEIKTLHAANPKYRFESMSQRDIIDQYSVSVIDLHAAYLRGSEGQKSQLLDANQTVSVEDFVRQYFERQGYTTMFLESRPFHVLFGTYMWLLIQDPADPLNRMVGFGDRTSFDAGAPSREIWTTLPEDFGTPGYGRRRARAISKHFTCELNRDDDFEGLFDYWLEPSESFRQYLWAHKNQDVDSARKLISILSPAIIKVVLRYLVDSYWARYVGWPDLLVYRDSEFLFVEVKSSGDKLSQDQRGWIRANYEILRFPFAVAKVHKKSIVEVEKEAG